MWISALVCRWPARRAPPASAGFPIKWSIEMARPVIVPSRIGNIRITCPRFPRRWLLSVTQSFWPALFGSQNLGPLFGTSAAKIDWFQHRLPTSFSSPSLHNKLPFVQPTPKTRHSTVRDFWDTERRAAIRQVFQRVNTSIWPKLPRRLQHSIAQSQKKKPQAVPALLCVCREALFL